MTLTVNLPPELAERVATEAARRGVKAEELIAEIIASQLPVGGQGDSLEAFIGSGRSGRSDLARQHREIRKESSEGLTARDL